MNRAPTKVFVQSDQSGAEALVVAYLCRAGKFRDLFLHSIKPHVFVALHVFADVWSKMVDSQVVMKAIVTEPSALRSIEGWSALDKLIRSSDEWEAAKRYYFIAKMICHASNYGMKSRTFRTNVLQKSNGAVALSLDQCEHMLSHYHRLFPEISQWHAEVVSTVKRTSMLRNLFGHPRVFTGYKDESAWKEWFAFIPQSTVGQITNYAIVEIQEELERGMHPSDLDVLTNTHDSLLMQCLPENRDYCARLQQAKLSREMTTPRGETFKMKCETQWSASSWGEMQELKLSA